MSDRPSPSPEDRGPEHPEFEPTHEEIFSDLSSSLDKPPTWQQQKQRQEVIRELAKIDLDIVPKNAEPFTKTLETIDSLMASEVGTAQWNKLDEETQIMDGDAAKTYERIQQLIKKRGDERTTTEEIGNIGVVVGTLWLNFQLQREAFLGGENGPLEYMTILNKTIHELTRFEDRLVSPQ